MSYISDCDGDSGDESGNDNICDSAEASGGDNGGDSGSNRGTDIGGYSGEDSSGDTGNDKSGDSGNHSTIAAASGLTPAVVYSIATRVVADRSDLGRENSVFNNWYNSFIYLFVILWFLSLFFQL